MSTDVSSFDELRGILVPDVQLGADQLRAKDAAANPSLYTENSPRAGDPVPQQDTRMVLEATEGQSQDGHLELLSRAGGHPEPEGGGYVWRDVGAGRGVAEYNGWDSYNTLTGTAPLVFSNVAVNQPHLDVIRLASQSVLVAGIVDNAGAYKVQEYDPDTGWGAQVNLGITEQANARPVALVQLPDTYDGASGQRVLAFVQSADRQQIDVRYSDNDGTSWNDHAFRALRTPLFDSGGAPVTLKKLRAAHANGQILLMASYTDGTTGLADVVQWASVDLGAHFDTVATGSATGDSYGNPSIVGLPDGGFVVGAQGFSGGAALTGHGVFRLASAFTTFYAGSVVTLQGAANFAAVGIEVWLDEDGAMYALYASAYDSATKLAYRLERSNDYGASWVAYNCHLMSHDAASLTNYLEKGGITSTRGRAIWATRWASNPATSYEGNSVLAVYLGGYSSHTVPDSTADADESYLEVNVLAWADLVGSFGGAYSYLPIQLPVSLGWPWFGTVPALNAATGELQVTSTAVLTGYTSRTIGSTKTRVFWQGELRVPAGQGNLAADEIDVRLQLDDGAAWDVDMLVRFDDTGFQVRDPNVPANVGAPVALDMTVAKTLRIALEYVPGAPGQGHFKIWGCTDAHTREWTLLQTGTLTEGGGGANNVIEWGHFTAVANTSYWQHVGYSWMVNGWSPDPSWESIFGTNWQNPECLRARSFPALPCSLSDGVKIRSRSGPTVVGEKWDIEAASDYPIEDIQPLISSSPAQTWRSVNDSVQVELVFDAEPSATDSWRLDSPLLGCWLLNANFKLAYLDRWNGAAWVNVLALDAGTDFGGLAFRRDGSKVFPQSVGSAAERYFFHGAHSDDHIDLGSGDAEHRYRRLVYNTEGAWRTDTDTKRPTLVIDPAQFTDGEPGSGTATLWRRDFGGIAYDYTQTADTYRLRIPAQTTAEGYFEVGQLVMGAVHVLGRQYGRGYSSTIRPEQEIEDRPGGSSIVHSDGPPRRDWTFDWTQQAIDLSQPSTDQADPDYITGKVGSTIAVATPHDTSRVLEGLLERIQWAKTPVLLLTSIPRVSGSTTEHYESRTHVHKWGRIVDSSVRIDTPLGNEGVDELEQVGSLTLREER